MFSIGARWRRACHIRGLRKKLMKDFEIMKLVFKVAADEAEAIKPLGDSTAD